MSMEDCSAPLSIWRGDTLVAVSITPGVRPTMAGIVREVAAKYGLRVSDLTGPERARKYAWPRQEAMWRCHKIGRSYPQIGAYLGGRDHCTVWRGVRRHEERIKAVGSAPVDDCDKSVTV